MSKAKKNVTSDAMLKIYKRVKKISQIAKENGLKVEDVVKLFDNLDGIDEIIAKLAKESKQEYYLKNQDKLIKYQKNYISENYDKHLESCKKWKGENKEHVKEYMHGYYVDQRKK